MDIHDKNWTWCLEYKKHNVAMEAVLLSDPLRMNMKEAISHFNEFIHDKDDTSFLIYKKDGKVTYPYTIQEGKRILKLNVL